MRVGAYAVIYLVWGSTYLAMRFAVETLPPFALASARFIISGAILFAIARARGVPAPSKADWRRAAVVGALLLIGGNASVLWAVQHVPSGVAALLVATTPLWLAILQRKRPTLLSAAGIALGIAGIGVLVGPAAFAGTARIDPLGVLVLVLASLSWAAGSLVQRGGPQHSALTSTAAQMLAGGAMLALIAVALGERVDFDAATMKSWLSLAYLTIFGSLLGFTCYAWLMRNDEPQRVATYAYVNPVVAVAVGALLGGEPFTPRVALAAVVIIAGVVALHFEGRRKAL